MTGLRAPAGRAAVSVASEADGSRTAAVAPLCAADRVAAFEAVMMMRCTAPIAARRRVTSEQPGPRMVPEMTGLLSEFNQAQPAYRLARLLTSLEVEARVDKRSDGGRHRYELYRVMVSPGSGTALRRVLEAAWRAGHMLLCRTADRALPRWQQRDRRALAVAAWRAALMAAGRRRSASLALRLADPDTTLVLVNAARTLGVQTRAVTRPGYQLLSLSTGSHYEQLLAVARGAGALEDAI
ncbi:MAG: hypothetical protein GEU94_08670 [Micromonosporaceae bacterium]|nr:hypothetical protein [Micromonosporaceae bacterium]